MKRTTDVEPGGELPPSTRLSDSAEKTSGWRARRKRAATATLFALSIAIGALFVLWIAGASGQTTSCGSGDPATEQGTCAVTVDVHDFASGAALGNFNYIVNVDNSKLPNDPAPGDTLSTESHSPMVRTGNQDKTSFNLPDGRYLITARALDHKMWGAYITLPNDATSNALTVRIDLTEQSADHPLPLGKINVFVFNDNTWTNGAPDTEEPGLGDFKVGLEEQTQSEVTVDYNNDPLCGGICTTSNTAATRGFVSIDNLGPASYFINVQAPGDGSCTSRPSSPLNPGHWHQTTTIDGGVDLFAPTEEGADGTGAPGEQLWEPPTIRTAYWFGFTCVPDNNVPMSGSAEITGTAMNWVEWAPYTTGQYGPDVVDNPFVALSDASSDQTVWAGRGDANGNFDIQGVPAGDYNLAVWDEQLSYIMRFVPVHVTAGATIDLNTADDAGNTGLGVSRWFGWLDGTVYKDTNNNGQFDAGTDPTVPNSDMDQRWRDGSIKEATFTDLGGHYEYPTAEGGGLGRWIINEQGFARFSAYPGPSPHDERTGDVTPSCSVDPPALPANPCMPVSQGGGLLSNQLLLEGHRATVDWGKRDYADGTPGQIVGITYFATTRNEFDAQFQVNEDYEAAVPDVTVYLEGLGPDGQPNTNDDVILNKYVTDHWQQPNANQDPQPGGNTFTQGCNPILDMVGNDVTNMFNPDLGPNCLEVPLTGQHTRDGAFDGGYAFASYCPESTGGYNLALDDGTCLDGTDQVPLVAGTYITHWIPPADPTNSTDCNAGLRVAGDLNVSLPHGSIPGAGTGPNDVVGCIYRPVKEEDVNVDLGNNFAPALPPPPCTGDMHVVDQSTLTPRSTRYTGDQATSPSAPLCDKRLVVLTNGQNANADFDLMTNFRTDPSGTPVANYPAGPDPSTLTGDIEEPGRVIGQVFNDIYFDRNQASNWYGEPRPIGNIPVGIYARVDIAQASCDAAVSTTCISGQEQGTGPIITYDKNRWRLIKSLSTSVDGAYETVLPSTETLNCPIPQGPCPGMYIAVVNDPGTTLHPNANYNPNVLTASTPFEIWPGLTDQLDTPIDPISGTACQDPAGAQGGVAPDPSDPARPELLQVSTPVVPASGSRTVTIQGDFIGIAGVPGAAGGRIRLTDDRTGAVTTLTRANGGITSWTPGTASTPDTIVINVPAVGAPFPPGPKELTIVTANNNPGGGGVPSVNGITLHVMGTAGGVTYNPPVVAVGAPPPGPGTSPTALQDAINGAAAGSLLVLSAGTYNENVLVWKPLKIQGLGPGGIIGAHEFQGRDPEDPRFHIKGSIIDGRFFQQNFTGFDAIAAAHPGVLPNFTSGNPSVVLRGADITVNAANTTAYNVPAVSGDSAGFGGARIDGLGLMTGHGDGAGGIQLQAQINNMQITNNVLENNGGIIAGGIGLGQLYVHGSHNYNVRIANDRLIGNGGLTSSGGLGIFYGSNNYEVANSVVCSNFSVEYGAGISHIGLSPGGSIHDNRIYYNEAVDSGGGIAVESELPTPVTTPTLGDGSGAVNIDRNLIQSNTSVGDDGGGIFVLDALDQPINIRNNMIVDNVAADLGGAIMLDDAARVSIANNTVSDNNTTGSSESSAVGVPHGAGLTAEANEPLWQGDARYTAQYPNAATRPDFSNPVALFNNIFWNNDAMTLDQFGPGATLTDNGFIDLEIHGTTNNADTFTPRYSDLTNGLILGPDGTQNPVPPGQGNISADPLFVAPFVNELTVAGSRLDPQQAAVSITGQDPPVGLTGDYHVPIASPVIDRGAGFSNLAFPAPATQTPNASSILAPCSGTAAQAYPADFDRGTRPQLRTFRVRTQWDIGADEVPNALNIFTPIPLTTGLLTLNWNNAGHPQCSGSTETR